MNCTVHHLTSDPMRCSREAINNLNLCPIHYDSFSRWMIGQGKTQLDIDIATELVDVVVLFFGIVKGGSPHWGKGTEIWRLN